MLHVQSDNSCPSKVGHSQLPLFVLLRIFNELDCPDLLRCAQVCRTWHRAASDAHLWQQKLDHLLQAHWSVLTRSTGVRKSGPSDLEALHPRERYLALVKFVPHHLRSHSRPRLQEILETSADESPRLTSHSRTNTSCCDLFRRVALRTFCDRPVYKDCHFGVVGSGLDHPHTGKLFRRVFDDRTRLFHPMSLLPSMQGAGVGATLMLSATAQTQAYDSSLGPSRPPVRTASTDTLSEPVQTGSDSRLNVSSSTTIKLLRARSPDSPSTRPPRGSQPRGPSFYDFVFNLYYLQAFRGQMTAKISSQKDRILHSRLFNLPTDGAASDDTGSSLSQLQVSSELNQLVDKLNGLVYAIDARLEFSELCLLVHEVAAIVRALPSDLGRRLPIAFLYIMPTEQVATGNVKPACDRLVTISRSDCDLGESRVEVDASMYTAAWTGSLLPVVQALDLLQLPNPWRLQKCASTDVGAMVQSVMWLRKLAL